MLGKQVPAAIQLLCMHSLGAPPVAHTFPAMPATWHTRYSSSLQAALTHDLCQVVLHPLVPAPQRQLVHALAPQVGGLGRGSGGGQHEQRRGTGQVIP